MSASDDGGIPGMGLMLIAVMGALALVVFTVMMLFGIQIAGSMSTDIIDGGDEPFNTTASPDPTTGTAVTFADVALTAEVLEVFQVRDTTNTSVNLTGADDSWVRSDADITVASDSTWTVCQQAFVDPDAATRDMTALSIDGRVIIQYNGTQGNWSAWYFDQGSTNSWRVNVSAPNQPANFSNVCASHDGTNFTVYRNTTQGDSVNTSSGTSVADVNVNSSNWDGRLDETRTFDTTLNTSQRQALVNYGVTVLDNATRTSRITYDEGAGSRTAIYFADERATLSNFTWDVGLNGSQLRSGTDYTIDEDAGEITALSGGLIDGAPVVWIDYRYQPHDRVSVVSEALKPAFELFGTGALVIPAAVVITMLLIGLLGAISIARRSESDIRLGNRRGGR